MHMQLPVPWFASSFLIHVRGVRFNFLVIKIYASKKFNKLTVLKSNCTITIDPRLHRVVAAEQYPLFFATSTRRRLDALAGHSGAHFCKPPELPSEETRAALNDLLVHVRL